MSSIAARIMVSAKSFFSGVSLGSEELSPGGSLTLRRKDMAFIEAHFDEKYYRRRYRDLRKLKTDLFAHFMQHGWREGRDPSPNFSTSLYLTRYKDVKKSGANPFAHWVLFGKSEQRLGLPFPGLPEAVTQEQIIRVRGEFDGRYYSSRNSDLQKKNIDHFKHYMTHGWRESRDPSPKFSGSYYVERYDNILSSDINPFAHWVLEGTGQGMLALPAVSMTIDDFEETTGREFSYETLSEDIVEQFPFGFRPERTNVPIVVIANDDPEAVGRRVRQARAVSNSAIHVVAPQTASLTSFGVGGEIRHWRFDEGGIVDAVIQALEACDAEHVGLWHVSAVPSLLAWSLLFGTCDQREDIAYLGAALTRRDGVLWRTISGSGLSQDGELARSAKWFRLRKAEAVEAFLGVANRNALLSALDTRKDVPASEIQEALDTVSIPVRSGPATKILVQGCALAISETAPSGCDDSKRNPEMEIIGGQREAIFFVDSVPPAPDRDAGSVTAANFIDIFIERGADVFFYCTNHREPFNPYAIALAARGVFCLSNSEFPQYNDACQMIAERSYGKETVFLTRVHSGGRYFEATRRSFGKARIVFNTVDLHGLREIREAKLFGSSAQLLRAETTYLREMNIIRQSDATILLSEAEVAELSPKLGYANLCLVPMVTEFRKAKTPFSERQDILFVGGFNHYPNVDAIEYIAQDLWEPIRKKNTEIKLKVVGPNFPDRLRSNLPDGVEVLGFVQDLGELLETVRLTVAPLRYGAGTKGKIGTSLAHGVPCVTTSLGAEGMGLIDGEDALIADEPEAFAAAVVRLYEDEALWRRMSANGYDFCEARYSRRAVANKMNALLDGLSE